MKLSVVINSYNQARTLTRAVESARAQQTHFEFEVVIADDASTDETAEVIQQLHATHNGSVRAIRQEQHVGRQRNFVRAYRACDTPFLAVLEADDYWISPHKLQRQVDILEQRSECDACFHNALSVTSSSAEPTLCCGADQKETSGFQDMLFGNFVPPSTAVYRHRPAESFEWLGGEMELGDWLLNLLWAQHGRFAYVNEVLAVVRRSRTEIGWGITQETQLDAIVRMYDRVNIYTGLRHASLVRALVARCETLYRVEALQARHSAAEEQWRRTFEELRLERTGSISALYGEVSKAHEAKAAAEREAAGLRAIVEAQGPLLESFRHRVDAAFAALDQRLAPMEGRLEMLTRPEDRLGLLSQPGNLERRVNDSYRRAAIERVRMAAIAALPPGASVLVVSKGDDELLRLDGRDSAHFPQNEAGGYAGYHPADSDAAIAHLESLREGGAEFLLFPDSALWWLDHYAGLRQYLERHYPLVLLETGVCALYALTRPGHDNASSEAQPAAVDLAHDEEYAARGR